MDNKIKYYSQWFPVKENDVADAFSRYDNRSDVELIQILKKFRSQLSLHFRIVPLPKEIVLWLTSLLARLLVKHQLQEIHTRTKLGRGGDDQIISTQFASSAINSLTISTNTSGSSSLALLIKY